MIEVFALAAEAYEQALSNKVDLPISPYTLNIVVPILLYAASPFAAGFLYFRYWRSLICWVILLAALFNVYRLSIHLTFYMKSLDDFRGPIFNLLFEITFASVFTILGIFGAKIWNRVKSKKISPEVRR